MLWPNSSFTNYILLTEILTAKQKEGDLFSISGLDLWTIVNVYFSILFFLLRADQSMEKIWRIYTMKDVIWKQEFIVHFSCTDVGS